MDHNTNSSENADNITPEVIKEKKSFKMPNNTSLLLVGVLIFSASIILASWLISNTGFSIRNSGSVGAGGVSQVDSVAVNGVGKIEVIPDMATINVTAREKAKSAQEAQQKMNSKVNQLITAIKAAGVKEEDISTNSYSSYQYWWWDWEDDYERTVSQSMQVVIRDIDTNKEILKNVVDSIINVDAQTGWYINFDLEDKTEAYSQARELAYEKALQKAEELEKVSKIKLGGVRYINDQSQDSFMSDYSESSSNSPLSYLSAEKSSDSSTNIPIGEIQIIVELDVQFEIL